MQLAFINANHHCERDAAVGRLMRLCHRFKDTSTVEVVLLLAAGSSYFFLTRFKLASRGSDGRQSVRQATGSLRAFSERLSTSRILSPLQVLLQCFVSQVRFGAEKAPVLRVLCTG
jgi:hypothetical protein